MPSQPQHGIGGAGGAKDRYVRQSPQAAGTKRYDSRRRRNDRDAAATLKRERRWRKQERRNRGVYADGTQVWNPGKRMRHPRWPNWFVFDCGVALSGSQWRKRNRRKRRKHERWMLDLTYRRVHPVWRYVDRIDRTHRSGAMTDVCRAFLLQIANYDAKAPATCTLPGCSRHAPLQRPWAWHDAGLGTKHWAEGLSASDWATLFAQPLTAATLGRCGRRWWRGEDEFIVTVHTTKLKRCSLKTNVRSAKTGLYNPFASYFNPDKTLYNPVDTRYFNI